MAPAEVLADPGALRHAARTLDQTATEVDLWRSGVATKGAATRWWAPAADRGKQDLAIADALVRTGVDELRAGADLLRSLAGACEDLRRAMTLQHRQAVTRLETRQAGLDPTDLAGASAVRAELAGLPRADDPSWAQRAGATAVRIPSVPLARTRATPTSPPGLVDLGDAELAGLSQVVTTAAGDVRLAVLRARSGAAALQPWELDPYGLPGTAAAGWLEAVTTSSGHLSRAATSWQGTGHRVGVLRLAALLADAPLLGGWVGLPRWDDLPTAPPPAPPPEPAPAPPTPPQQDADEDDGFSGWLSDRKDDLGDAAGLLQDGADGTLDALGEAAHEVKQFGIGAGEATWDLGVFAYESSPVYMITNPKGYLEHVQGLASGLVFGVQHPKEFGKAMLDWETWKQDPARALGHLVPDLVLTVATLGTGGVGVAGSRSAAAATKLDDVARAGEDLAALAKAEDLAALAEAGSRLPTHVPLPAPVGPAGSAPAWLVRMREGSVWHRAEQARMSAADPSFRAEVLVDRPPGAPLRSRRSHYRVDGYSTAAREIVSMKRTQLADVTLPTARAYLDEAVAKYAPGTRIADVPSNAPRSPGDLDLRGELLQGDVVLQVPVQTRPIPTEVLDYAEDLGVRIRQGDAP